MFATFGFGGIPRHMGLNSVSHCFPVNGSPVDPRIQGVGGVLQTYRGTLPQIGLGGPTNFENVIRTFTQHAEANAGFQQYQILLIITDGMITDMQQTVNQICISSRLPTSIIIVGVGQADFTSMEQLDGDDGLLRDSAGRPASRDIVQFVRFLDCQMKGNLA